MIKFNKTVTIFAAILCLAITLFFEIKSEGQSFNVNSESLIVTPTSDAGVSLLRNGQTDSIKTRLQLLPGDIVLTAENQTADINFSAFGTIRVAPKTKFVFQYLAVNGYTFSLEEGRAWVNTYFVNKDLNIKAPGLLLNPKRAIFDLNFDGSKTTVNVKTNSVNVEIKDPSGLKINGFLIPEGAGASFLKDKIFSNIGDLKKLYYSKLIKEFDYSILDLNEWNKDLWVSKNIDSDKSLASGFSQKFFDKIRSNGLKTSSLDSMSHQLKKVWRNVADNITFDPKKANQHLVDSVFDQLGDSEYLFVYSRNSEAKDRLLYFKKQFEENFNSETASFFAAKLAEEYFRLANVMPDDPLYQVKSLLLDLIFTYPDPSIKSADKVSLKFELLRFYFVYINLFADNNTTLTKLIIDQYYSKILDLIKLRDKSDGSFVNYLFEQNILLDTVFRKYAIFYQDGYFAMKHNLDVQWFSLIPSGDQKTDEEQFIVSNKIDFLKQLKEFCLSGKVSIKDAKLVAYRLINEVKDFQADPSLGISQLFAIRLKDYGNFLRFLNITGIADLQGTTISKKYQQFVANQGGQISIEQAVNDFLASQNAVEDAAPVENVSSLTQESLQDDSWPGVSTQSILDSQTAETLQTTQATQATETSQSSESSESIAQTPPGENKNDRIAKILLVKKLKMNGVAASESDIEIIDRVLGVYKIKSASLIDDPNITLSFDLQTKQNVVESIIVIRNQKVFPLNGQFILADLTSKVLVTVGLVKP